MAAILVPLLAVAAIAAFLWAARPRRRPAARHTVPWEGRTRSPGEAARVDQMLRDALDRTPFGDALAQQVWSAIVACPPGQGAVLHHHRDYCGHALIRTEAGIMLCEAHDGGAQLGPALAEWTDRAAFAAFLARQSDHSCSGWDPAEKLFFTDDSWARNNQRLTRDGLRHFAGRG